MLRPVRVAMPASVAFVAVSAGDFHAVALDRDGRAWSWGGGPNGVLGQGSMADSHVPAPVAAPRGVRFGAVAAGTNQTIALDAE